jgi:hypothetical protein
MKAIFTCIAMRFILQLQVQTITGTPLSAIFDDVKSGANTRIDVDE